MPNKHFCQGPECHTNPTSDRFLKSKGIIRGRYAYAKIDEPRYYGGGDKYFCSQRCKFDWLEENMSAIEMGIPVPFITHRRASEGYEKTKDRWGGNTIEKIGVDNNTQ
jgi:hypothetical protein